MTSLTGMRRDYGRAELPKTAVANDPIVQFEAWFKHAQSSDNKSFEPNAMTLATAGAGGEPSARIVLLKGFDADGFVFYTNYSSQKGRELEANPRAALLFHWQEWERQVRINGSVAKVSREQSTDYFQSRPPGSRLGAVVSRQSQVVESREVLQQRYDELQQAHPDGQVTLPQEWGGYRLQPDVFEFWQGRSSRLHDRIRYSRPADAHGRSWLIERLEP